MTSLYQIASDYERALGFDIGSEDDADALIQLLDEVQDRFEVKAENVAKYLANIEAEGAAYRAEEVRLAERRHAMERRAERLREYLAEQMRRLSLNDLAAGVFRLKFVKNPPSLNIYNEAAIPPGYFEPQPARLDRAAITRDLKSGHAVPGAEIKQDTRLRIS